MCVCVCVRARVRYMCLRLKERLRHRSEGESQIATTVQYRRCMCTQCVHVQMHSTNTTCSTSCHQIPLSSQLGGVARETMTMSMPGSDRMTVKIALFEFLVYDFPERTV